MAYFKNNVDYGLLYTNVENGKNLETLLICKITIIQWKLVFEV